MAITDLAGNLTEFLVETENMVPWAEKAAGEEGVYFDEKVAQIDKRLSKMFGEAEDTFISRMKERGIARQRDRQKIIDEVIEPKKDEYKGIVKNGTGDIMDKGRYQVVMELQAMGRDVGFRKLNPAVLDDLQENVDKFAITTFENRKEEIRKIMRQVTAEGKGVGRAETLMRREFGYMKDYKFRRVARTEGTFARNAVKNETMKNYNANYKQWLTAGDAKVRTSPPDKFDHVAMHGQIVRRSESFVHPFQGWSMSHPGARGGALGNIINCRCTIRPYLPSNPDQISVTPFYV